MVENTSYLHDKSKIVMDDGTPTTLFIRFLRDRGLLSTEAAENAETAIVDAATALSAAEAAQAEVDALEAVVAALDIPSDLDDLDDVDTTTTPPTDGQALVYDNASSLWVPGDVAASGGGGGGGRLPTTLVSRTATAGVSSTGYIVQWSNEILDEVDAFDGATDNTIFTVPSGYSRVRLTAHVAYGSISTSIGHFTMFRVNGTNIMGEVKQGQFESSTTVISPWLAVSPGDEIEVYLFNNSGSAVTLNGNTASYGPSYFQAEWDDGTGGGGGGGITLTTPEAADFTITRDGISGTFAVADDAESDGVNLTMACQSSACHGLIGQSVGSGPWTATAAMFIALHHENDYWWLGFGAMDTTETECFNIRLQMQDTSEDGKRLYSRFTNNFSSNTEALPTTSGFWEAKFGNWFNTLLWFRIVNDGTDLKGYISVDEGKSWMHVATQSLSSFTNDATIVGFFGGSVVSSGTVYAFCPHFEVT